MSEDTPEPINAELQKIRKSLIDLIRYISDDEDINDLTEALNRVRDVQYRLYGV